MRPDEGKGADFLGSASILLLQAVGAEEDEDHALVSKKEKSCRGESSVGV